MPSEQIAPPDTATLTAPVLIDQLFRGLSYHFILTVSGHRDLLTVDVNYIRDQAGRLENLVLTKLSLLIDHQTAAGRAGVVVVSPLAEGADCVVAWAALQLQQQGRPVQLRVVLPYNLNAYLNERDKEHQQLILRFINKAGGYAVLRTDAPVLINAHDATHRAYTNRAYVAYCVWLTSQADAAIVLWDGVDTVKPGGTSDFVRMAIFGEDSAGTTLRPFPTRLRVVHHLITPRQHNPFPLARYFGSAARKVFQPGGTYQWYELQPEIVPSAPNPAWTWLRREGFTKIGIPFLLSMAMMLAGIMGFEQYRAQCPDVGSDLMDSIIKTLNLVTLGSITTEGCPAKTPVPVALHLARFFGAALWLYAIVQVYLAVFQSAGRWVTVFLQRNSYAIVVGLTSQTYALLRDLKKQYRALTVIDPAGNSVHTTAAQLMGINIVAGDPTDEALLQRSYFSSAQRIFVMTGDDDMNVRTAQQMDQLTPSNQNPETTPNRAWHVEVQESRKRYLLSQTTQQNDHLHPFNLVETMVRRLQVRYPIDRFYQTPGSHVSDVVIMGFGPAGQAVALNSLQLGYFADGRRVRIHVFAPNHAACEAEFLGRYPYLVPTEAANSYQARLRSLLFPAGTLQFYELPNAETALLDPAFALYQLFNPSTETASQCLLTVYVCLETPIRAITMLSELLPRLDHYRYRDRLHHQHPITDLQVFCHYELSDEHEVDFMEKRLNDRATYVPVVFFGKFADECTLDAITARQEDRLAKQVALWYYLLYGGPNAHLNATITRTLRPPKPEGEPLAWAQSNYSRLLSANGVGLLDSMANRCWTSLQEKDRASNRRAADHAWIKLRTLGLQTIEAGLLTDFDTLSYLDEYRQILHQNREKLARLEHLRWSAEKMLEGYAPLLDELPGQREVVKQIEWKGDKKEKWRVQKLHLDLDLFENLSLTEQQKDYDQILGLPYMLLAIGLRLTGGQSN